MNRRIKVKQRDTTDCGAACLASVSAYYKLQLPVSRIRQLANTDKKSTTVLGILEAAQFLGFQAKGAKGGTIEVLPNVPLPAIAHVQLKNDAHHYVVIYKVGKRDVWIMDPADGRVHRTPMKQFEQDWTGALVVLMPDEQIFRPRNEKVSNTKRFWQLMRPHRGVMLAAFLGAIVYTILGLSTSIYIQKIVDFVIVESNVNLLNTLSVAMLVILIFQILIGNIKTVLAFKTGQFIDASLILGYYKHLLQLPQRFFDTMKVGEIISRITDAVKIRVFVNEVVINIVLNIFIVFFSIGLMFLYYWKLALIMLAIIPFYILLYYISNRVNRVWQRRIMEDAAELETQLVESLNSVGTIKRFGVEEYSNLKTENRFVALLRTIFNVSMRNLYLGTSSEFVTRIFTIIILWTGSYFVVKGELSPGELLSFYALIGYFTGPATSLIGANKNIQDALIASDRLFEIVDLEIENVDEANIELLPEDIGDIVFNNVCFRYGATANIFEGLNLKIKKGTVVGIVGESGSGKSTLLSLLQNLYPLKDGTITIGGNDIKFVTNKSLRNRISVVPQQIDLLAGTIASNIAIGEDEPDLKRVVAFAHLLGINEFIEKLPNNYFTAVGEHGANLSGGQKQRIAIARALYRNPEVLILDEATASLDPVSEAKVQEGLQWFKQQGKTIIIIAHRLKTIKNSDDIVVLQEGKLIESGSHEQLISLNGAYAKMWAEYV